MTHTSHTNPSRNFLVVEAISARWVKDWDADLVRSENQENQTTFDPIFILFIWEYQRFLPYSIIFLWDPLGKLEMLTPFIREYHRCSSSMWKSHHFVPQKKFLSRTPRWSNAHPSVGIDVRMPHLGLKPVFVQRRSWGKRWKSSSLAGKYR